MALKALNEEARFPLAAAFLATPIAQDDGLATSDEGLATLLSETIAEAAPAKQRLLRWAAQGLGLKNGTDSTGRLLSKAGLETSGGAPGATTGLTMGL